MAGKPEESGDITYLKPPQPPGAPGGRGVVNLIRRSLLLIIFGSTRNLLTSLTRSTATDWRLRFAAMSIQTLSTSSTPARRLPEKNPFDQFDAAPAASKAPPSAPAHQYPNEATLSAWHPTLWQRFRTSGIGRKILGPTPIEQEMIGSGREGWLVRLKANTEYFQSCPSHRSAPVLNRNWARRFWLITSALCQEPSRRELNRLPESVKEGDTRGAYGGDD